MLKMNKKFVGSISTQWQNYGYNQHKTCKFRNSTNYSISRRILSF